MPSASKPVPRCTMLCSESVGTSAPSAVPTSGFVMNPSRPTATRTIPASAVQALTLFIALPPYPAGGRFHARPEEDRGHTRRYVIGEILDQSGQPRWDPRTSSRDQRRLENEVKPARAPGAAT